MTDEQKLAHIRQFVSNFIVGQNSDALFGGLAEGAMFVQDQSVAVTDQLTISTARDNYLDKRLSEVGFTRPGELGMSDESFAKLGIQVTATKQISEIIHTVLDTFYGVESVRAWTQSGKPGPYVLREGMDLILEFDNGEVYTFVLDADEVSNLSAVTPQELSSALTRFIRNMGLQGFAAPFLEFETNEQYLRIFGSAQGPYGLVRVLGGEIQKVLEFPQMRDTNLLPANPNNTVWEITKHTGDTVRFRWIGGSRPLLERVLISDKVLIYGSQFLTANSKLVGTFTVTNVSPAQNAPDLSSGWFEFTLNLIELINTPPGTAAGGATPPNAYTITQSTYNDLKFYLAKKNVPYDKSRYALAFEPAESLLKIYLPATTKIVERDLIGGAHLHMNYTAENFDGVFGSTTDPEAMIEIVNEYTLRYPDTQLDNGGSGGTISYSATSRTIDYVFRENGYTNIVLTSPHGLVGEEQWIASDNYAVDDQVYHQGKVWKATIASGPGNGGSREPLATSLSWESIGAGSNKVAVEITVDVDQVQADDPNNPFLGSYLYDAAAPYTLTDVFGSIREPVETGESKRILYVQGEVPNEPGFLLLNLNKDNQEGPFRYLGSQRQVAATPVNIVSISKNNGIATVVTGEPHGAIPNEQAVISGASGFNGTHVVKTVPSSNVYTYDTSAGAQVGTTGTSLSILSGVVSQLLIDSTYQFKSNHAVGDDFSVLSNNSAQAPAQDGSDYSLYITGTANARVYAEHILRSLVALGINLELIVVYPSDRGLGNEGGSGDVNDPPTSEKVVVWGVD